MTNSELHALRCIRKMLVEMGRTAMEAPKSEKVDALKNQINQAHGAVFLLCQPYADRVLV